MTEDGMNWLIAALDPYHDFEHPIAGYPDQSTTKSLVKVVQQSFDVAAPVGVAGNWDCHVLSLPFTNANGTGAFLSYGVYNEVTGVYTAAADPFTTTGLFNTISAIGVPAGQTTLIASPGPYIRTVTGQSPVINAVGPLRLIGAGFEVTNTTSDLYKQGTCTVYRQSNAESRDFYTPSTGTSAVPSWNYTNYMRNVQDSYRVPGTVQWAAELGAYVPLALATMSNPILDPTIAPWTLSLQRTGASSAIAMYIQGPASYTASFKFPFNTSGAYFTGLSNQTTLTVTTRFYIEMYPPFVSDLLDLVRKPAEHDVFALGLYSRIVNHLPPGTRKGDNDAGDWFRAITNAAAGVVESPFGDAMLTRAVGPLAPAVQQIVKAVNKKIQSKQPVRTAQNAVNMKLLMQKPRKGKK